jgi:crossover junction endodeoxyribonuclease RusA
VITINLPWPPSVNRIWRRVGNKTILSAEGREFRKTVQGICAINGISGKRMAGRLSVCITANPPDRRKRDIDNLQKAPLDALTHAAVWEDDSQIDELLIRRDSIVSGGSIKITINEISG